MNYYAVLKKHYDGKIWGIAEDYSTLDWGDETPKPEARSQDKWCRCNNPTQYAFAHVPDIYL